MRGRLRSFWARVRSGRRRRHDPSLERELFVFPSRVLDVLAPDKDDNARARNAGMACYTMETTDVADT